MVGNCVFSDARRAPSLLLMSKTQTATETEDRPFVRLTGEAAVAVRSTLGEPVRKKMFALKAAEATEDTYRVVTSPEQTKALKEGRQVWAKPGKGDKSLRLRDAATSKPMPEARLEKVGDSAKSAARPSVTKVLGPAAWEAMAMATQQHYLVEINDKLEGIATNVDEVLQRLDDDKRGALSHVAKTVEDSRTRLAHHGALSSGRVDELRDATRDADRIWHQLHERFRRHLTGYGEGHATREDVEHSWELLLCATRVLTESSALLTALPLDTVEDLENTAFEERERVLDAITALQELAYEFAAWHLEFQKQWFQWDTFGSRNPVVRKYRRTRGLPSAAKPKTEMLTRAVAKQAAQLALPAPAPAALFITTHTNGEVSVMAEPTVTAARVTAAE
jgi:hypothetical protein